MDSLERERTRRTHPWVLLLAATALSACGGETGGGVGAAAQGGTAGDAGTTSDGGGPPSAGAANADVCIHAAACGVFSPLGTAPDRCLAELAKYLGVGMMRIDDARTVQDVIRCSEAHPDCSGFTECVRPADGTACTRPGDGGCFGQVQYVCTGSGTLDSTMDCAADGMSCDPGVGRTTGAACADGPDACDGDAVVSCKGGHEVRRACPEGMTCLSIDGDVACARPSIGECDPALDRTCDGDRLLACDPSGATYAIDCGAVGLRCGHGEGDDPSLPPRCLPAASACEPDPARRDCEGDGLVLCSGGERVRMSCIELGYDRSFQDPGTQGRCTTD